MARQIKRLNARLVASITEPGLYRDGGGLALQVGANGSRSWIFRFTAGKRPNGGQRERDMGLGAASLISLAKARELAEGCRVQLQAGIDPIEARRALRANTGPAPKAITFRAVAEACIEARAPEWTSPKHRAQWEATLEQHVYPVFGSKPVHTVGKDDILAALRPIWTTKTETATRVRQRIEAVLNFAMQAGHRPEGPNPARWAGGLDAVLAKPAKVKKVEHHPALPAALMKPFMERLQEVEGMGSLALQLVTLTACRSGEARGMEWKEIDRETATWTIPAERTKTRKAHRVPLSPAALAVLDKAPKVAGSTLVFTAPRGGPLSDMTLAAVIKRMNEADGGKWADAAGRPAVPHGMRSSFRDWASELTHYPRDVVEMALGHAIESSTEAAYRRGDLLDKRRPLMDDWAAFCGLQPAAKVVPIGKGRRKSAA